MAGLIWVIAEQANGEITDPTIEMLQDACELGKQLPAQVWAVLATDEMGPEGWEEQVGAHGADQLRLIDLSSLLNPTPEMYALALSELARETAPALVLVPNTLAGHELGARLASRWNAGFVNDCVSFRLTPEGRIETTSLTHGEQLETISVFQKEPAVISFRPNSAGIGPPDAGRRAEKHVHRFELGKEQLTERMERIIPGAPNQIDITESDFIISAGRGAGSRESIILLEQLACVLGASVACTRLVDDNGLISQERRVGLTGKTVKPQVYIAIGVSGAREHVVGMDKSKSIIAINNDPKAEIFNLAHLGILGDAREIMLAMLKEMGNKDWLESPGGDTP